MEEEAAKHKRAVIPCVTYKCLLVQTVSQQRIDDGDLFSCLQQHVNSKLVDVVEHSAAKEALETELRGE